MPCMSYFCPSFCSSWLLASVLCRHCRPCAFLSPPCLYPSRDFEREKKRDKSAESACSQLLKCDAWPWGSGACCMQCPLSSSPVGYLPPGPKISYRPDATGLSLASQRAAWLVCPPANRAVGQRAPCPELEKDTAIREATKATKTQLEDSEGQGEERDELPAVAGTFLPVAHVLVCAACDSSGWRGLALTVCLPVLRLLRSPTPSCLLHMESSLCNAHFERIRMLCSSTGKTGRVALPYLLLLDGGYGATMKKSFLSFDRSCLFLFASRLFAPNPTRGKEQK